MLAGWDRVADLGSLREVDLHAAEVTEGQVIAVVMPMAPNRGEAKIKLDGVNQGRIDTYSQTKMNRVVMWQTPPLEAGVHTIAIINLATEGHPRIDVDAFLLTGGFDGE